MMIVLKVMKDNTLYYNNSDDFKMEDYSFIVNGEYFSIFFEEFFKLDYFYKEVDSIEILTYE